MGPDETETARQFKAALSRLNIEKEAKEAAERRASIAESEVAEVRAAADVKVAAAEAAKQRAEAELAALRATLEDEKSRGSTTPTTADAEKAPTAKASLDPSDAVVRNLMPAFDASISRGLKTMTLNIVNFTDNAGDQAALQSKYHLFSEELTKARPGVVFVQEVQSGDGSETDGGKKAMRKLTELINKKLGSDDRYKFVVSLKAGGKERYGVMWDTTILGKGEPEMKLWKNPMSFVSADQFKRILPDYIKNQEIPKKVVSQIGRYLEGPPFGLCASNPEPLEAARRYASNFCNNFQFARAPLFVRFTNSEDPNLKDVVFCTVHLDTGDTGDSKKKDKPPNQYRLEALFLQAVLAAGASSGRKLVFCGDTEVYKNPREEDSCLEMS